MKLNPYIFFFIKDDSLILWDYLHHKQYALDSLDFKNLLTFAQSGKNLPSTKLEEYKNLGIIGNYEQPEWGWDILSQVFHVGTSDLTNHFSENPNEFTTNFLKLCQNSQADLYKYQERTGTKIKLPTPYKSPLQDTDLLSTLQRRQTSRSFTGKPIPLATIATLLYYTFSDQNRPQEDHKKHGISRLGMRKTSPSGGGIHPSEAYLVAFNVENLAEGIYHYSALTHSLTVISTETFKEELSETLRQQYFCQDLSAGIWITSRFNKLWGKYSHSRAYRVALLDVGHLSQSLQLLATGAGLLTWLTAAFQDTIVNKTLKLPESEKAILFLGLGTGLPDAIDPQLKQLVE